MIQKLIMLLIIPVLLFSFSDDTKYAGLTKEEVNGS